MRTMKFNNLMFLSIKNKHKKTYSHEHVQNIEREIGLSNLSTRLSICLQLNWNEKNFKYSNMAYTYEGCLLSFGIREQKQILIIENCFIVSQNIPHYDLYTLLHAFEPIAVPLLPLWLRYLHLEGLMNTQNW